MEGDYQDDFEAMEAEAEALAQNNKKPIITPKRPVGRPIARPQQAPQQQQMKQAAQEAEPQGQPVWVAFYQPEVIGIANTQTNERMEGFKDEGTAQAMARVLNDLNTVIVSGGYE